MSYIERVSKIENLFGLQIDEFIRIHVCFAITSLYLEYYSKLPSINKRDYKNKEISFYVINCKNLNAINITEIINFFQISSCILYYCNFIDNEPICTIENNILYIRSPINLQVNISNINYILEFKRVSRLLKVNIK